MRKSSIPKARPLARGLVIVYEDRDILVVDKPPGLLTVGTDREKSRTAYFILTNYVAKGRPRARDRIFIVHRLDREASGILVFAKNEQAKLRLQGRWNETEKKYLAVVHGKCKIKSQTISTYLAENKAQVVYSTTDTSKGKLSHTAYNVLRQTKDFALLEVDLLTGRRTRSACIWPISVTRSWAIRNTGKAVDHSLIWRFMPDLFPSNTPQPASR